MKKYSECYSVEDFIEYYYDAKKPELRAVLKTRGGRDCHLSGSSKNERDAVVALLSPNFKKIQKFLKSHK